jgi:hypothetical protein
LENYKLEKNNIEEKIQQVLNNPNFCPCLFLGKYTTEFKRIYKDRIFSLYNLNDVRELVDRFMGIADLNGRYFVIDGISNLTSVGQNSLLKFIEENKFPIILLSYFDRVSPIILSRIKFIFKSPVHEAKNTRFVELKDALRALEEKKKDEDFTIMDEVRFYAENCPKGFVAKYSSSEYGYSSEKILKILSKL